jgi:Chromate transport protein ChrA
MAIFLQFLWLGCTSFGGPVAHLGIFRRVFVEQKQVFSESDYANLVALCQVIPGPASSQVGMGIGYRLGGTAGAFAAFVGFTLPSALLMAFGGWAVLSGNLPETSWLVTALKLVALGIVTQAVIGMWGPALPITGNQAAHDSGGFILHPATAWLSCMIAVLYWRACVVSLTMR